MGNQTYGYQFVNALTVRADLPVPHLCGEERAIGLILLQICLGLPIFIRNAGKQAGVNNDVGA